MAKKRTPAKKKTSYSDETFEEISELFSESFDDIPEAQAEQIKKHLSLMKEKYNQTSEDIIKAFQTKLGKVRADAKNRYGTALKRTRDHFGRSGRQAAAPYLGFIIGIQHRVNDINSMRLKDLKIEYNAHIESKTAEDVEVEIKEYNQLYAEFNKIKNTDEDSATAYMRDSLGGRFVVYDENNDEVEEQFIENMVTWDKGSRNFNFGKILKPNPSLTYTAVILDKGESKLVDISVKGLEAFTVLRSAPKFTLVMMRVVKNEKEGQRWWVDKAFAIDIVEDIKDVLKVTDPVKVDKKILKYTMEAVPNTLQTSVDNIDSWQRKITNSTGKDNCLGLVKGTVSDIYYGDNDTATITLTNESYDLDDLDMWEDEEDDLSFRVRVSAELVNDIDFDVDTVLYVWGEIYRGAYYDPETREYDDTKKAEMPTQNAWGFKADPELKNERVEPSAVSSDDYIVSADNDEVEEDDSGFVIKDE